MSSHDKLIAWVFVAILALGVLDEFLVYRVQQRRLHDTQDMSINKPTHLEH